MIKVDLYLKLICLLEDETIDTTIDVDVDELCTITVANKPNIRPAIGLERIAPSVNAFPVILPPTSRKAELIISSEQTKI
jgi:hypothetical protein